MPWRATAILACALLAAAPAAAQRGPRVLALTGVDEAPEWPHSLAIELAYVGGQLTTSRVDALDGPPALAARVAAQVVGAEAVVWLGPRRDEVRVALADSDERFRAPLARGADPRTIALVASSLLEEAFATAEPTGPPLTVASIDATPPREALTRPIEPVEQLTDDERPPVHGPLPEQGISVRGFGAIGTGGMARVSDVGFDPGTWIRGAAGVRIGAHFQLQLAVSVGLVRERVGVNGGLELQPFGRACPEAVAILPVDRLVELHVGGHGCLALGEMRHFGVFDPFPDPFFESWVEDVVWEAIGGGYVGLALTPGSTSVLFRVDLDGAAPFSTWDGQWVNRQPDVVIALSTLVGFF